MHARRREFPCFIKFIAGLVLVLLMTGCIPRSIELELDRVELASKDDEEEAEPAEGRLILGHFSDRRGKAPRWIGDIFGWFRYPKSVLATDESVTVVVRRFVQENAESRDLVTGRRAEATYQLSGEILQLQGTAYLEAQARAHINVRLTTPDGSKQVYEKDHEIYLVRGSGFFAYGAVKEALEEALNKVIADALEDDDFLEVIESAEDA